jgi:hypothetical protein
MSIELKECGEAVEAGKTGREEMRMALERRRISRTRALGVDMARTMTRTLVRSKARTGCGSDRRLGQWLGRSVARRLGQIWKFQLQDVQEYAEPPKR